jgi:GT2 family glycosyltransferase
MKEAEATMSEAVPGEPLATIMIPTKNRADSLKRLLDSIDRQDYRNLEILVIDDGSEPPLEPPGDPVRVLRNPTSRGQMAARNQGLAEARGEYVFHFDDDAELIEPDTLRRAIMMAEAHPECGAIGMRQLTPDGDVDAMQPTHTERASFTAHFFGYAFLVRRSAYLRIGGFNERFQYYYDENEFCLRLRDAGYRVIYDPTLRVIHHQDPRGRDRTRSSRLQTRNAILTAMMHFPAWAVAPWSAKLLRQHLVMTRSLGKADWGGLVWVFRESVAAIPYAWRRRRPMRMATIRESRSLRESPRPVEAEAPPSRVGS